MIDRPWWPSSVLSVLALVLLAACSGGSPGPGSGPATAVQQKRLTVDGRARTYRVFAPPSLDRQTRPPLVLVLGGFGNTANGVVAGTKFDREAAEGGFVAAYPDGFKQAWNAGYCCGSAAKSGIDDVSLLVAVIDHVQDEYGTDPARVYVVGVSNGGMMAYRMGCERAGRVAGVASVAGAMLLDTCHPDRAIAVMEIHGTADPLVPFGGGATAGGATKPSPSTAAIGQRWAELNHCDPKPALQAATVVATATWSNCAEGSAVRTVVIEGAGHTWFARGDGPINGAIDAAHAIWTFFSSLRPAR